MATVVAVKKWSIPTWLKEAMEFAEGSGEQQERRKMSRMTPSLWQKRPQDELHSPTWESLPEQVF